MVWNHLSGSSLVFAIQRLPGRPLVTDLFLLLLESGSEEEEEKEDKNAAEADLIEEQSHSRDSEEDGSHFSDGDLKEDEQYNSKTHTPTNAEFEGLMKNTR